MSTPDPVAEARRFADTAYSAQLDVITRKFEKELKCKRAELAARGSVMSGAMVREMARINGERITALLQTRLDGLLEGLELHDVHIDEPLTVAIVEEIVSLRKTIVGHAVSAYASDPIVRNLVSASHYQLMLEGEIAIAPNSVRIQVDRKRLKKRPNTEKNVYHIQGVNPRVNINSEDHSLNAEITPVASISAKPQQDSSMVSKDSEPTHKVLLYVFGIAGTACVAAARATASAHPAASWWLYYSSVVLYVVPICIALVNRWQPLKVKVLVVASILVLAVGGLFWRYRPLESTTNPAAASQPAHVDSQQDQKSSSSISEGPPPSLDAPSKPIPAAKLREKPRAEKLVSDSSKAALTQSCPGGICIGGNNSGDPTVINMERPLPKISWKVRELPPIGGKNPAVNVDLSPDESFSNPTFRAECSRPCESESGGLSTGGRIFMPQLGWDDLNPNIAILHFSMPSVIYKNEPVHWVIRSRDSQQVVIKSAQAVRF